MKNNNNIQPMYQDHDYSSMGWHDCTIHGICLPSLTTFELSLDIDYIFKWIQPEKNSRYYKFLVSPSTLVFTGVQNLRLNITTDCELEIDSIFKDPSSIKKWVIQCHQGAIEFDAVEFKQYTRVIPIETDEQAIERTTSNPVSFAQSHF